MIRVGFEYTVTSVKKRSAKDKIITCFTIKDDSVYNGTKFRSMYWNFTVWDDLNLDEGDRIKLKEITALSANEYKERLYQNYTAIVEVVTKHVDDEEEPNPFPDI